VPIYEYECNSCHKQFERLVFSNSESINCPACGSNEVTRRMSVFGFKSGGDKGAASSRVGSSSSGCSGCTATSCASCK